MSNQETKSYKPVRTDVHPGGLKARTYLDYASTTPLDQRVQKAMEPFFSKVFGNPSSIHTEGVIAKKALDSARTNVARLLESHADEIVFTSGGTESNTLALFGVLSPLIRGALSSSTGGVLQPPTALPLVRGMKPHIVTTNIEHSSILEPLRALEREGRAEVTYVPVEANGVVKAEKILAAVCPNTVLVSVQYANNEIGTVQPIAKIGKAIRNLRNGLKSQIPNPKSQTNSKFQIAKSQTPLFHSDACQAPLYLRCLVNALGVDLLSLDAHKIYGPKGVGALYVRRGTPLSPVLLGGGQERGLRSTTENIPGIVGFAEALRIATAEREKESVRIEKLRDSLYFLIRANKKVAETMVVNGSMEKSERLPNNVNVSLPGVDTEFLTLQLDTEGVSVSTKSSCLKDEKESYVISALGGTPERARSSLRVTLGRFTTKKEIDYCAQALKKVLPKPRK